MPPHLGDIVVGDIGQPRYHKCTKKQKNIMKEKEERHFWHCGWPLSPTTMSPKGYPFYDPTLVKSEIINPLDNGTYFFVHILIVFGLNVFCPYKYVNFSF